MTVQIQMYNLVSMKIFFCTLKYVILAGSFGIMACSSLPSREGTIKINPSAEKSRVDVAATVNGQPIIFVLDTGAQENVVNTDKGLVDLIARGTTVSRNNFVGEAKVISFDAKTKMEGLEEQNLNFHYSPGNKYNLLSTRSYLSKRILFNFKENLIRIGGSEQPCSPAQKFRILRKSIFMVRLLLGEQKAWFLWDTGASNSYVDLKWAKENTVLKNLPQDYTVNTGNEMSKKVSSYAELKTNLDGVDIFGIFPAIDLSGLDQLSSDIKGIVGLNLIIQKNWFFDLNSKKFCIFN